MCSSPLFGRYIDEKFTLITKDPLYIDSVMTVRKIAQRYNHILYELPCGKCAACKVSYASQWSTRIMLEAKMYNDNYFITLTYDNDHIVYGSKGRPTLVKKDISKFMKALRQVYRDKYDHVGIRFYGTGEYGDKTFRPHYHVIMFNLPLNDLVEFSKTGLGDSLYTSDLITGLWKKGHVVIGKLTLESANYTARYVNKKIDKLHVKKFYEDDLGVEPEASFMSRMPGIGEKYFNRNVDSIYSSGIVLPDRNGVAQLKSIPRYYDKLLKKTNELNYLSVKDKRAKRMFDRKLVQKSTRVLTYEQELKVKDEVLKKKLSVLKRDKI